MVFPPSLSLSPSLPPSLPPFPPSLPSFPPSLPLFLHSLSSVVNSLTTKLTLHQQRESDFSCHGNKVQLPQWCKTELLKTYFGFLLNFKNFASIYFHPPTKNWTYSGCYQEHMVASQDLWRSHKRRTHILVPSKNFLALQTEVNLLIQLFQTYSPLSVSNRKQTINTVYESKFIQGFLITNN